MWMTKNQALLPSAFQNASDQRGSPNSVAKFQADEDRFWPARF
jgi:hypothetical protein